MVTGAFGLFLCVRFPHRTAHEAQEQGGRQFFLHFGIQRAYVRSADANRNLIGVYVGIRGAGMVIFPTDVVI